VWEVAVLAINTGSVVEIPFRHLAHRWLTSGKRFNQVTQWQPAGVPVGDEAGN
jgi:hypothetical protein